MRAVSIRGSIRPDGSPARVVDHPDLRAVIVVSGEETHPTPGFERLEDETFLLVDKDQGVALSSFG